jgi:penicillin-binding protein 2
LALKFLTGINSEEFVGSFDEGKEDIEAVAGSNLYTEMDIDLQLLGEKLMSNKVGSIVAVQS